MLLSDHYRPITDSAAFLRKSVWACADEYVKWTGPLVAKHGSVLRSREVAGGLEERLQALLPLTKVLHTRTLFLGSSTGWTCCFTNGWRGTDTGSIVAILNVRLECEALRVACVPDLGTGRTKRYGVREVAFFAGEQKPHRAITVANDGGRWTQWMAGEPVPGEADEWYSAQRKRDRFTAGQLRQLVEATVPGALNRKTWEGKEPAILVERTGTLSSTVVSMSLDEVQADIPLHDCWA